MSKVAKEYKKLQDFFRAGTRIEYKKGEIILRPEDVPRGVHLIDQGYVKSYSISRNGQINIRVFKTRGDILPMVWALGGKMHHTYMESISDAILYRVSRSSFRKFISDDPDVARYLISEMVKLYSIYDTRIGSLEYRYAYDRIIAHLLILADRFGRSIPEGGVIVNIPLRHHDIADSVNATRETVSRELAKMERKKLIWYQDRKIVIKGKQDLQDEI